MTTATVIDEWTDNREAGGLGFRLVQDGDRGIWLEMRMETLKDGVWSEWMEEDLGGPGNGVLRRIPALVAAERARIREALLEEFGCDAPLPEDCLCGHGAGAHRSGGLCEACIPAGDHTGAESACQRFCLPADPNAELKSRLRAALDRICPEEKE